MTRAPAPVWEDVRLAALYQVSREISARLELDELLPRVLHHVTNSLQAHSSSLLVLDARGRLSHAALLVEGQLVEDRADLLNSVLEHGLAGWVVRHGAGVRVPDTAADPRWHVSEHSLAPAPRSVLCVPLFGRERVVGVLTVSRLPADAFTDDDLTLVTAIAAQAGIAVENAQLFAAERRERHVSITLREVARTVNATLALEQVLPLVLEQLGRVVAYDTASILLQEGRRLRVAAARGFESPEAVLRLSFDISRGISARVVRERRPVVLEDVRRSPEWLLSDEPETFHIRAWIGAPLVVKDQVLGLLAVDSREPGVYTPEDGQLVAAFAEQAAVAVRNARLFAQSERRAYGLRALAATAQAVNATAELSEVLRLVVRHAQQWLGMEGASLALLEGEHLVFKEAVGPVAERLRGASIRLGAGVAGWVAQRNQALIVPDVRADPRFFGGLDEQTGFVTRALACVPVRIGQRAIGIIEVVNPASGTFEPETVELLESLASLAGTAIVQAQRMAELQAAEHRFAGLFEDSIDPILITNLDGVITDANHRACAFFGYERHELVGRRITSLHRVNTSTLSEGRYTPLLNGAPIHYQTSITTRANERVPVEVHAKLIERGGQKFIQWVQHDLSERLALEELRNDLMSMIIHDLRSPLGNIISSLDILRDNLPRGTPDDDMVPALVSIALRSAGRLSRLVDSLLDLRRLEAGEVLLHRVPVALAALVDDALEQVQPTAVARRLSLRVALPPGLPEPAVDEDLIRRVIVNLLDNAIKYSAAEGDVRVSAHAGPGPREVTVSVTDTGPGVPEAERHRIFQKFTRVQRESAPKGLGLGLAFCKLAVEAHGGRIWVESPGGQGASFHFTLPLAAPAVTA